MTVVLVVAAAMIAPHGHVLMQQRPLGKTHGGLWEFPGGKVEPGETPISALVREIEEEIGVRIDTAALSPVGFAGDPLPPPAPRRPHVILLYACRDWQGQPQAREAEAIGWFAPAELASLAMPPLDYPLAAALDRWLETPV